MLTAVEVNRALKDLYNEICKLASEEQSRLGDEVTKVCSQKYRALKKRWAYLENLPEPKVMVNVQPIANTNFGLRSTPSLECCASPLGSTGGRDPDLERLEHLVAMS